MLALRVRPELRAPAFHGPFEREPLECEESPERHPHHLLRVHLELIDQDRDPRDRVYLLRAGGFFFGTARFGVALFGDGRVGLSSDTCTPSPDRIVRKTTPVPRIPNG